LPPTWHHRGDDANGSPRRHDPPPSIPATSQKNHGFLDPWGGYSGVGLDPPFTRGVSIRARIPPRRGSSTARIPPSWIIDRPHPAASWIIDRPHPAAS
jgi:hypothetical protein